MQSEKTRRQPSMERFSSVLSCVFSSDFWGTRGRAECSASEMLSSKEPSVYGPGAWSNHRQRTAEGRQHK
jgi:hypothetical protein